MIYALQRLAEARRDDLRRYNIEIQAESNVILWQNLAVRLKPYSTTRECERELNRIIREAKELKRQEADAKQSKLFEEG